MLFPNLVAAAIKIKSLGVRAYGPGSTAAPRLRGNPGWEVLWCVGFFRLLVASVKGMSVAISLCLKCLYLLLQLLALPPEPVTAAATAPAGKGIGRSHSARRRKTQASE